MHNVLWNPEVFKHMVEQELGSRIRHRPLGSVDDDQDYAVAQGF